MVAQRTSKQPAPKRSTLARGVLFFTALIILGALGGCPSTQPRGGSTLTGEGGSKRSAETHRWRAISDMDPVWSLASTQEHLWVGTPGGLLRYGLDGGAPLRVSGSAGPGKGRVIGVQADSRGHLWAVSEGGIGRYESGAWSRPTDQMPVIGELTTFIVTSKNALWLGGTKGLVVYRNGQWSQWFNDAHVTAIAPSADEERLWIGTKQGALELSLGGVIARHEQDLGMPCNDVRTMVASESDVWAICERSDGSVLAHFDGLRWRGFTVELPQRPMDISRCNNRFVLLTDDGLWRLEDHNPEERTIAEGLLPLKLVFEGQPARPRSSSVTPSKAFGSSEARTARPRASAAAFAAPPPAPDDPWQEHPVTYVLRPVSVPVYHGAARLACDSRGLWIGTDGLGATRIERGGRVTVYRTLDLVVTERPFSVAADGEGNSWFLSRDLRAGVLGNDLDDYFEPSQVEQDATAGVQILSFGSRGRGAYALGRMRGTNIIRIYQHVRGEWFEMLEREVAFPPDEQSAELEEGAEPANDPLQGLSIDFSFFEVDPQGRFWIGLLTRPENAPTAQPRPRGVLIVDLEVDHLVLHGQEPRGPGALSIPDEVSVVDFTREGDTWLAGLTGAVLIRSDGTTERFSEANGLLGGIVNDLAIDANDVPWVATPEGLGRFQQGAWRFFMDNLPQGIQVLSLAVDSRDELWAGGNRGAVHYNGRQWEVLTTSNGLISNRIRSIHVDGRDRVWFVTDSGISLLERGH
jgi:ligand-binding sensor domain-containing protein